MDLPRLPILSFSFPSCNRPRSSPQPDPSRNSHFSSHPTAQTTAELDQPPGPGASLSHPHPDRKGKSGMPEDPAPHPSGAGQHPKFPFPGGSERFPGRRGSFLALRVTLPQSMLPNPPAGLGGCCYSWEKSLGITNFHRRRRGAGAVFFLLPGCFCTGNVGWSPKKRALGSSWVSWESSQCLGLGALV